MSVKWKIVMRDEHGNILNTAVYSPQPGEDLQIPNKQMMNKFGWEGDPEKVSITYAPISWWASIEIVYSGRIYTISQKNNCWFYTSQLFFLPGNIENVSRDTWHTDSGINSMKPRGISYRFLVKMLTGYNHYTFIFLVIFMINNSM